MYIYIFGNLILSILFTFVGDLGGSTVHDEVGADVDSKHSAGLPKSPSSSGGFHQFSSKGLCREDICAQHYVGGNMELYLQDMFCCLPQEFVFRL